MPLDISRPILGQVDVAGDDTSTVHAHNLHGNADAPFQRASHVPAVPRQTQGYLGIDADGSQHSTGVLHRGLTATCQEGEAGDGNDLGAEEEGAALAILVGGIVQSDGEDSGTDIWGDGHELGVVGRIAHAFDDGRQEECEGVDGTETADTDDHVDVDLPVGYGLPDVLDVEVCVCDVACVSTKTSGNFVLFHWSEK